MRSKLGPKKSRAQMQLARRRKVSKAQQGSSPSRRDKGKVALYIGVPRHGAKLEDTMIAEAMIWVRMVAQEQFMQDKFEYTAHSYGAPRRLQNYQCRTYATWNTRASINGMPPRSRIQCSATRHQGLFHTVCHVMFTKCP